MSRRFVISLDQTWHDHFIYFQLHWLCSVCLNRTKLVPGSQTQHTAMVLAWIMFSLLKSDKFSLIFAWQLSERNVRWQKSNEKKIAKKSKSVVDAEIGSFVKCLKMELTPRSFIFRMQCRNGKSAIRPGWKKNKCTASNAQNQWNENTEFMAIRRLCSMLFSIVRIDQRDHR